ncbi:MAG: succinate dehydrogenase, hydrophobic membrane anchor protein [Alphaproteobacteria bacterium]|nr:succinate dehydrogenase, hydrophobic membrane anchor protein [Alphaproteobacteria bacterium]
MKLKWEAHGFKTPLARARGLGSLRSGLKEWVRLRVAAIASTILAFWFVWFVLQSVGMSHLEFVKYLAVPVNSIAMILFVITLFYHLVLGIREIMEDYIHSEWVKILALIFDYMFFSVSGVVCVFFVLKIAFSMGV